MNPKSAHERASEWSGLRIRDTRRIFSCGRDQPLRGAQDISPDAPRRRRPVCCQEL